MSNKLKNRRLEVKEQFVLTIDYDRHELTEEQKRVTNLYLTKQSHNMDNLSIMEEVGHKSARDV